MELRQYTLKPGRRDILVDLFDRCFVEGQESLGMTVIGQFRDRRREDRFVWLRGFPDMEARHQALEAFYGGPIWAANKAAANDTMLEFDDVLLLKPARPGTAFRVRRDRARTAHRGGSASVLAGIYRMPEPVGAEVVSQFEQHVAAVLQANDIRVEGIFVTESAPNTFTKLPVREGEHVLAWFGVVNGDPRPPGWLEQLAAATVLDDQAVTLLDLEPTPRSALGSGPRAAR